MRTSVVGRSCASVCTFPNRLTTLMPEVTRPKIVCLPSSQGVGASVIKNCRQQSIFGLSVNARHTSDDCQAQPHDRSGIVQLIAEALVFADLTAIGVCTSIGHAQDASSSMMQRPINFIFKFATINAFTALTSACGCIANMFKRNE